MAYIRQLYTNVQKVSLLVRLWVEIPQFTVATNAKQCQPPCEAVSWNSIYIGLPCFSPTSASLWGCELKYSTKIFIDCLEFVSLLVRLWVEMLKRKKNRNKWKVSLLVRLWVEIRYGKWVPGKDDVSLLVRLWVEIKIPVRVRITVFSQPPCEAVSWNIETETISTTCYGQPPCEAVSWNWNNVQRQGLCSCQPPCEAVSWNNPSSVSM